MSSLTREKLAQAAALTAASGVDAWLTFVRETAEGGDPVLPLVLEGGLVWESALLVGPRERIAVVGNFDADALRASGDWDEVIPYVEGIKSELLRALDRLIPAASAESGRPRIAVNYSLDDPKADGLSHGMFLRLEDLLRGTRFEGSLESGAVIASALRSRKTPDELACIREAVIRTEALLREIGAFVRPGLSEREIFDRLQERTRAEGYGFSWDSSGDPIVNSGPDSMIGHGTPSPDIRVAPGHIFHIDFGITWNSYSSDLQRCWFVKEPGGEIPPEVLCAFFAVRDAITEGAKALRPGTEGWQVDAAARSFVTGAGFDEYKHALGHQVGRVAHDGGALLGPRWERYGRTPNMPIEEHQVFTLELGVTVPGHGYLGLEEMVRVTADGCEFLSERQMELPAIS